MEGNERKEEKGERRDEREREHSEGERRENRVKETSLLLPTLISLSLDTVQ
jgi:hypothetical protein